MLKLQNLSIHHQTIATITFLLDQSSGHCAFSNDALIAHEMNVSDKGKQPFLQDTKWDVKPQKMVTSNGLQKV